MRAKAPNGKEITRTVERIMGANGIYDFRMENGSIVFEYDDSGCRVDWDSQQQDTHEGKRVFLDEDGNEWTEDKLTLVEDGDDASVEDSPIGQKLKAAGFSIWNTGGNIMAWGREFAEDGAIAYVGQGDGELGENGDETSWGCSISDKEGNHYEEFEVGDKTLDEIIAHVASAEAQLKAALRVS